jgi:hypothetical protein
VHYFDDDLARSGFVIGSEIDDSKATLAQSRFDQIAIVEDDANRRVGRAERRFRPLGFIATQVIFVILQSLTQ